MGKYAEDPKRFKKFHKDRGTLFGGARAISDEFGAHVAVVAFSPSGAAFAFGGPTVASVLRAYLPDAAAPPSPGRPCAAETVGEAAARVAGMRREVEDSEPLIQAECPLFAAASAIQERAGKRSWWDLDVDAIWEEELPVFIKALEMFRAEVQGRIDAMAPAPRQQ
ncbi:hypothetical protein U9M48_025153 [Paspalum notatum var. saurae]|uniref:MADS-box domain-containing protein n=1 Tax=Paspalum notatum var. saurae TaxID=547442 RepID=A0AAQ3TPY7_PASNO